MINLGSTVLTAPVGERDGYVLLDSLAGVSSSPQTGLFVGGEYMTVSRVEYNTPETVGENGTVTPAEPTDGGTVHVSRMVRRLAHPPGAQVWVGRPHLFHSTNPAPGAKNLGGHPWINIYSGELWTQSGSRWALSAPYDSAPVETVGATGEGVTILEHGAGRLKMTELVFENLLLGESKASNTTGLNKKLFTFPIGASSARLAALSVALTSDNTSVGNVKPAVAVGTVAAAANAGSLSSTAADIVASQTMGDVKGAVKKASGALTPLAIPTSTSYDVFLNAACTWGAKANIYASGSVTLVWEYLG